MDRRQLDFREVRPDAEAYFEFIDKNRHPVSLLLDRIADRRNLGALLRIADAARVKKIYGYRTDLLADRNKFKRIARNADAYLSFRPLTGIEEVRALKETATLVGLEITTDSIPFTSYTPQKEVILIVGNEKKGISDEMLALTDQCIHIPMFGMNTSMNVSVAAGIALYGLLGKMGLLNGQDGP